MQDAEFFFQHEMTGRLQSIPLGMRNFPELPKLSWEI